MKPLSDQKIINSWKKNASPWIKAIENSEIQSRIEITNRAIVEAVIAEKPQTVLDVGCGEGWLIRQLADHGVMGIGIDVVPELIEFAAQKGKGQFLILSYEDLSLETIGQTFDVIVCNFSLIGKESVNYIFQQAPKLLNEGGALIIQTLHPLESNDQQAYQDGWRPGSWVGFDNQFTDPAPWYFRTIDTWKKLYRNNNLELSVIFECQDTKTSVRLSIIFVGKKKPKS